MTVSSRTAAPSKALFRDLTCRSCLNVLLDPFAQKYCLHCGDAVLVNQCTCGRPVPHKSDGSLYNHCSTCGAGTDDLENKRPKIRLWAEEDLDIKCRCPCAGKTCTGKNATNDTDSQPPSKQQQFNYQQTPIFAKKRKRAKIKSNKENESSQSEAEPQETMAVYQPDPTRSEQGDTIHVEQLNNAGTSQIEMNVDLGGLEDNEGPTSIPRQRGSIARGPRSIKVSGDNLAKGGQPATSSPKVKKSLGKRPETVALIEVALVNLERRRRRLPPFDDTPSGVWIIIAEHLSNFGYTATSIHAWRKKFYRLEQRYTKGIKGGGKFLYEDVFDAVLDRLETNYDFYQPDQYTFVTQNPTFIIKMDCENIVSGLMPEEIQT